MANNERIYRVSFYQDETIYELYAKQVSESDMFGFLTVEDFIFGAETSLVVDPSEEKLKLEFKQVKRTFIPMSSVLRIDEVNEKGNAKIRDPKGSSNISAFPMMGKERNYDKS